ncbi:hypothetical protein G3545_22465 [Starkeya sp. ORNL1]|uniref:hypothetical protein n=1 Tax=Starkeya sp. ORNL1 TaxID=2709380 RepID=UPI0014643FBF|nr:hypothetical protein [Starkeya sp. ORNL1]QJP16167.1 hypothetical protein G3545_22465 [Starkeya sp. ORNL1]
MRRTLIMISLLAAIGAAPSSAFADEVRVATFRGNVEKACARFAGRPPGRAECRAAISSGGALLPGQAYRVAIADFRGVLYYTTEQQGLRVVATFEQEAGQAPIRMISMLAPTQSMRITVPDRPGVPLADVEVQRVGDLVVVRETKQTASNDPPVTSQQDAQ